VFAQVANLFLSLGGEIARHESSVPAARERLAANGILVAPMPPEDELYWPWYRLISERRLASVLAQLHPGAEVRLSAKGDAILMWVRAPDVMDGQWMVHAVTVDYLRSELNVLLWLAGLVLVILAMSGMVTVIINRPLEQLVEAAVMLGRGIELPPWRPQGPVEVRRLGHELYQAADAIRSSLREREFFFAAVSHDLRTPLARMRLALDFFEPDDAGGRDLVDGIARDIDELDALVQRLIERLREDREERPAAVNLCPLIETVAMTYRHYGEQINVSCHVERTIEVLPHSFRRLLRNLIQNAIDHGRGPIDIEAWAGGVEAFLSVRDRGDSLTPQRLETIRRRASSGATQPPGRGLGLSIALRIAEDHGGELQFDDAQPGLRVLLRWSSPPPEV
jgi:two-component system osmolarity sensor histidine kinase EnvZ